MILINTDLRILTNHIFIIGPFIFKLSGTNVDEVKYNHAHIHWKQQMEMLIVLYYIWYILEFIAKTVKFCDLKKAFKNISFEQEAFYGENNLAYPRIRKHYAWRYWI